MCEAFYLLLQDVVKAVAIGIANSAIWHIPFGILLADISHEFNAWHRSRLARAGLSRHSRHAFLINCLLECTSVSVSAIAIASASAVDIRFTFAASWGQRRSILLAAPHALRSGRYLHKLKIKENAYRKTHIEKQKQKKHTHRGVCLMSF